MITGMNSEAVAVMDDEPAEEQSIAPRNPSWAGRRVVPPLRWVVLAAGVLGALALVATCSEGRRSLPVATVTR